jgi:peptidoglycan/xylan/chitin deacetylase (PgdA/CDA1 family)
MSLSRGDFLKQLGKSIPGMVFNSGAVGAAHKLLGKMAAASGENVMSPLPVPQRPRFESDRFGHINGGPVQGNRIALTFDDGPNAGVTDRILDELKQRKLHATFFMIGQRVAAEPDLARRVLAEGHEIGNHTYTHPKFSEISDEEAAAEIDKMQYLVHEVLNNYDPAWFRPPYGIFRQNHFSLLERHGLRSVLGNVNTADWSQPGEDKIIGKILAETKAGSIIICHDLFAQTANCIGPVLDGLAERGFQPVTLSALLA